MNRTMGWMGVLAGTVAAVFVGIALLAQSDVPFYGDAHAPPAAVTLFLMLEAVGLPGILVGAVAHAVLFLLGALHLLRRPAAQDRSGLWPTWAGMLMLGTLSAVPWIMGAGASGLQHQGGWLVLAYGSAGFGTMVALLLWLSKLAKDSEAQRRPVRPTKLLFVHFAAHVAALLVLFPCLGEPIRPSALVDDLPANRVPVVRTNPS